MGSARDIAGLQQIGIGAVLNCGAEAFEYPPGGVVHKVVSCEDTEGYPLLAHHLEECLAFAESCANEGRGLLVHCRMGLNRSACLLVALLMIRHGMMLLEAVRKVAECRAGQQ